MTTIRPRCDRGPAARGVLTLYYPLLPRQPRICNHQLSRRPPRHWPPSAIPRFNAAFQSLTCLTFSLPSRPDLGGIHLIPTDAAQTGAAASNSRTSWSAPACGTSRSARTWTAPRPAAGPAWRPAFAAQHLPITTPPAWRNRWAWTAAPTKARWGARSCWPCWAARSLPFRACAGVAVRIRRRIVQAARKTALASTPSTPSAPGLLDLRRRTRLHILPGRSLIEGLRRATQPEASGQLYAFSCYRATEYVTVLGIAQELEEANPRWRATCSASGKRAR